MYFFKIVILCVSFCFVSSQNCGSNKNCPLRCQDKTTGKLLSTASNCQDSIPDCGFVFNCSLDSSPCSTSFSGFDPKNPKTFPKIRPENCDDPELAFAAMKCAKTCNLCCERPTNKTCADDGTHIIDCKVHQHKCEDPSWKKIMEQFCAKTCGKCANPLIPICEDKVEGCKTMKGICHKTNWTVFMYKNCAKSCGLC